MTRCEAKTAAGTRCKLNAKDGKKRCVVHTTQKKAITNPLQMFRAGMLDPNSPISKLDKFTVDKIVGPLRHEQKDKGRLDYLRYLLKDAVESRRDLKHWNNGYRAAIARRNPRDDPKLLAQYIEHNKKLLKTAENKIADYKKQIQSAL